MSAVTLLGYLNGIVTVALRAAFVRFSPQTLAWIGLAVARAQ